MGIPTGPLLQALAERALANLRMIDELAPQPGDPEQDRPPYSDTQLLISLLGVLVFPHEGAPDALGDLLANYDGLRSVVTVHHASGGGAVEIAGAEGDLETIDPSAIKDLPRLLRNAIAHFNVRPINKGGRFGGVRVWNKNDDGEITLIADLNFDALRPLAEHILMALADPHRMTALKDPDDPLEILGVPAARPRPRKAPRVSDGAWPAFVEANGGNYDRAKTQLDRLLAAEASRMRAVGRTQSGA